MASTIYQGAAQCELTMAGGSCIAASALWLIVGATALILKPRDRLIPASMATAPAYGGAPVALSAPVQETIATTQNKDGSTTNTIYRTTMNPDGTHTVTQMTQVEPGVTMLS
jgi:hypothetical protein